MRREIAVEPDGASPRRDHVCDARSDNATPTLPWRSTRRNSGPSSITAASSHRCSVRTGHVSPSAPYGTATASPRRRRRPQGPSSSVESRAPFLRVRRRRRSRRARLARSVAARRPIQRVEPPRPRSPRRSSPEIAATILRSASRSSAVFCFCATPSCRRVPRTTARTTSCPVGVG